jgi:hypothetical protein
MPLRLPQGNQSPIITTAAIVGVTLLLITVSAMVVGLDPYTAGDIAGRVVIGGVVLGAWASQARTPWSRGGYLWRFGVALIVVAALSLLCSPPSSPGN